MKLGALAMRGLIGGLFIGHGTQKLFGWFGGSGPDATAGIMEKLEFHPPRRHALMAGAAEAGGGLLLALGALTPLATASLTAVMTTAIRKVHAPNGPWVTKGGWEYNAVLIAAVASLVDHGPGSPSVDAKLFPKLRGPVWAALAVGSGVAGSYLVTEKLNAPAPEEAATQTGADEPASPNGVTQPETAGAGA